MGSQNYGCEEKGVASLENLDAVELEIAERFPVEQLGTGFQNL